MDELLDFATFDPSMERDPFGPLPGPRIVAFAGRTHPDKRAPKPIEPGLSPGILIAPRAA